MRGMQKIKHLHGEEPLGLKLPLQWKEETRAQLRFLSRAAKLQRLRSSWGEGRTRRHRATATSKAVADWT